MKFSSLMYLIKTNAKLLSLIGFAMFGALTLRISFIPSNRIEMLIYLMVTITFVFFLVKKINFRNIEKEEIPLVKLKTLFGFKDPKHFKKFINFLIDSCIIKNCTISKKKEREEVFKFFGERFKLVGEIRLQRNLRENIANIRFKSKYFDKLPNNIDKNAMPVLGLNKQIEVFSALLKSDLIKNQIKTDYSIDEINVAIAIYLYFCHNITDDLKNPQDETSFNIVLDKIKYNYSISEKNMPH